MALSPENRYSRFVTWLKILLPLAALALLSTLFLFAKRSTTDDSLPYAEIQQLARDPRVTQPAYSGVSSRGDLLQLKAETARPVADRPGVTMIDKISLRIDSPDGSDVELTGGAGEIDSAARIVTLSGGATLSASSGYTVQTPGLRVEMDAGVLTSTGAVEVTAPFGTLSAGGMTLTTGTQDAAGNATGPSQQMVFNRGVRLIYQPK
ncbi:MAG: hypothetical protein GC146_07775 [Limimaricola sp.]|uniref:LPS export ABC transporter periplasmic protein LptC n=1 Tax=Limimaricola sp. TaxID=2211665 RepID=UPI001D66A874|nr:LPS export ABC transporter periplasmic protein LptC [Limimaricola sp.]MBI1417102.1 hypothetical protein [Limimaricola sp.]